MATRLNQADRPGRLYYIPEDYDFPSVTKWLEAQGVVQTPEGLHDDFAMTAMMMSVEPDSVRSKQRIAAGNFRINGVDLAPAEDTINWGRRIIDFRAQATVKAIQAAMSNDSSCDREDRSEPRTVGSASTRLAAVASDSLFESHSAHPKPVMDVLICDVKCNGVGFYVHLHEDNLIKCEG